MTVIYISSHDNLVPEHKALLDIRKQILWKEYLTEKLNDTMGNEVKSSTQNQISHKSTKNHNRDLSESK